MAALILPTFLRDWLAQSRDWRMAAIGLTLSVQAFETYIDLRQLAVLNHPCPPVKLLPVLNNLRDTEEPMSRVFAKSQHYARAKQLFGFVTTAIGLVEGLATFVFIDKIWYWAIDLLPKQHQTPVKCALAFIVATYPLGLVTSLPLSYYKTFVLEEEHGFNKTTKKTWVLDQLKSTALGAAIGLPLISAAIRIMDRFGASFIQYLMAFLLAVQLVAVPAYPYLIAPLFNKFTPLSDLQEHAPVQKLIESLAKRLAFPLGKVWVIDGSTRSAHSNAYFTGLPYLTKQIVLYDTLLKDQTPEEVEAVLAHEMGHWKNKDTLRMIVFSQAQVFLTLSVYSFLLFNQDLYRSFGVQPSAKFGATGVPVILGFMLAGAILSPLDTIVSFVTHAFSRRLEFAADAFAAQQGYISNLKSALINMMAKNSAIYDVDPLYSAMHHSHPTLSERVAGLDLLALQIGKKAQ